MKLFISYARVDKPLCKQIAEKLEDAHEVWYDKRLHPGQDWWDEIQDQLNWCDGFVYLLSPESVKSEHCQKEYKIASDLGKDVFPTLIQARTEIPASLSHLHYADLSQDLNDITTLLNALTVAERKQLKEIPSVEKEVSKTPPPAQELSEDAISKIADVMENAEYDNAVFLIKQALANIQDGRVKSMLTDMLWRAESNLEVQALAREAEREYAPIRAMVKREAMREFGCKAFVEFREKYPNYDPDDLAADCGGVGNSIINLAQSFTGKRNADWNPYITTFDTLKISDMPFCLVPAGSFRMGSGGGRDNEKPIHPQRIEEAYWIAQYPVTNAQWQLGVKAGVVSAPWGAGERTIEWYHDRGMSDAPVAAIDWYAAQKFAEWVGCRLPTEVEWEYAARGVESWLYPWGNEWVEDNAVVNANSGDKPWDVTSKPKGKSWVGAYHMSGNMWEWTSSIFADYPYTLASENEWHDNSSIGMRGGSFMNSQFFARSSSRRASPPHIHSRRHGFRLVAALTLRL